MPNGPNIEIPNLPEVTMNIPLSFSMKRAPLTWGDVVWAYHKNILSWKDLVSFADFKISSGYFDDQEMEISLLGKDRIADISAAADSLAGLNEVRERIAKNKWLYLSLAWLFENKEHMDDPLSVVEDIYADFEYPPQIQSFVRYMPATDNYAPRDHTAEENNERLMGLFEAFLNRNSPLDGEFEHTVLISFAFLERRYGFSHTVLRPSPHSVLVRYESRSLFVNLVFGPPAYEPEMSFGRLGVDDRQGAFSFEAGDLIQLASCQGWNPDIKPGDAVARQVAWFASLLQKCGQPCLLGDPAVYEEMKSRREAQVAEWQRDERKRRRDNEIDAAWKAKDYRAVVDLCSAYERTLSNLNQKRLKFAKERAG